jgi:hypothetical protein
MLQRLVANADLAVSGARFLEKIDDTPLSAAPTSAPAAAEDQAYSVLPTYRPNNIGDLQRSPQYWKQAQGTTVSNPVSDIVTIHVCDDNRHVTRDFNCKKDLLVKNMKYFKNFLSKADSSFEDVDISV